MNYETHTLTQGDAEWHAHRADSYNASDAGTALGINPYKTRQELIRELATGISKEIDAGTQRRFDDGHRFEKLARPLAEDIIGDDLSPTTVSLVVAGLKRKLSASLDGATFGSGENWEHKSLSESLSAAMSRGEIPEQYHPQMEQGMMITGATRCLFMASKWDSNDQLVESKHLWYEPNHDLRAKILAAWQQLEEDLAAYVPQEVIPTAVAAPIKDLPAVSVSVSGELMIKTNFAIWGKELNDFIARIPEKPSTDQEFADCKAAVVALKTAEEQLDDEEARMLKRVVSIDEMQREKKVLWELSRTTRLALEKLVVARDITVKQEIVQKGKDAAKEHIDALNLRLGKPYMPDVPADFAAAIRSKRSYDKMRESVNDAIAQFKLTANAIADRIQINLASLRELADGYQTLFADTPQIVLKANDDLVALIKTRINEHKEAEQKRLDAARARDKENMRTVSLTGLGVTDGLVGGITEPAAPPSRAGVEQSRPTAAPDAGPCSYLYPLFEHMSKEHGLTLTDSELEEIRLICLTITRPLTDAEELALVA